MQNLLQLLLLRHHPHPHCCKPLNRLKFLPFMAEYTLAALKHALLCAVPILQCNVASVVWLQLVNEQIGTENMKRRVELESKRQRMLSRMTRAMWADHTECQRLGYDWTARRAKWESQLKELQTLRDIVRVPRLDTQMPMGSGRQYRRLIAADDKLPNDELYVQALDRLEQLQNKAEASGQALVQDEEKDRSESVLEWFKVSPVFAFPRLCLNPVQMLVKFVYAVQTKSAVSSMTLEHMSNPLLL